MALVIETFEDLVHIIETHPDWRRQLKRALFDIDIEAALTRLEKAVERLVETQRQQTANIAVLKNDVSVLKTDVSTLKGKSYEQEYRFKASGIFGRFIRRGRDRTDDIADQLHDAVAAGQVSEQEFTQVLAADLLWGGKSRLDETDIVVVLEASWLAEIRDVERPQQRTEILRRVGFKAVAVVAGIEWDEQALALAKTLGVAIASNGQVNADLWRAALTAISG